MTKKYFIVADIHSFYNELIKALNDNGWEQNNPNHILINCGDLLDRGPDSIKCLDFVNKLYTENRAILIRGNHEDLMEELLHRGYFEVHDIYNKTEQTVAQVIGIYLDGSFDCDISAIEAMKHNNLWNTYINNCVDYYELNNNIFVHGWIPCFDKAGFKYHKQSNWRKGNWKEARWLNGMEAWSYGVKIQGKTIYCGHWHTSWGHSNLHNDGVEWLKKYETYYINPETGKQEPYINLDIFYDKGIVAMDGCVPVSHKVNCKVIELEDN